ncbi:MAG: PAS domain S-box protein [Deltaproteobacteria bacterium]|nr:PAS domain S-box protein [Deltaproteobacteria bacterium]
MSSYLTTSVICMLVTVFLWRQNRKHFAGMTGWIIFFGFQAVAVLLIILRGRIPDWQSIVLSNILVMTGALACYMGLERFVGKISSQVHNYLLLAAFILVSSYFTFVQPNLAARAVNISLGLLIVSLQGVWLLWRRVPPDMRRITRGVDILFGAFCLISLVRIVVVLTGQHFGNDFFRSGAFEKLVILSYQMLVIILAYSLTLMVNQRLLIENQDQGEKFSKAFRLAPYAITLTRLADGQIIEVNDGFVNLTGYTYAEAIGKTTLDLGLWAKEEDRVAFVDEFSKSNRVQGREFPFRTKSGEILICLLSAEIIMLNDQQCILSSINDITERKRAEEALRESEQRFRILAETIEEVFWMADIETQKTCYISPGYERVWGRSPQSLYDAPKSFIEAIHPEDRGRVAANLEAKKTGQSFEQEYRIIQPDGSIRWIWDRGFPVPSETGQITRYAGAAGDITERKQMEAALISSDERYQALIRTSIEGFCTLNTEGRILEVSHTYCAITGYARDALLSMHLSDLEDMESPEQISDHIQNIITEGWDRFETRHHCYDGSVIDVQINAVFVTSQSLIMVFINDVTERKLLEMSRNELLAERQAILDNVPVGIAYLVDRRFVWCNFKAAAQLGYSIEEVIGKSTEFILLSEEDYEEFGREAYRVMASGEAFHKERLFKRKNNTLFWCSVIGKAIDPGNPSRGFIWIVEDISQRKEDEEALVKAKEEALSANQAKSEFLAKMSHEIRTPLNSIIGFNQLLLNSKLSVQEKTFAEAVSQAGENLLLIINDILDFSKIEAAKMELDLAGFEFENLLKETINMFQPAVDQKKLDLRLEISPSLPKVLIGDKEKLRQILSNLLSNAIKFTPSGSIEVKVRRYEAPSPLPQKENDLVLLISVADTGVGLHPGQVHKIFEAFVQGDASSTQRYRGTGLGLAITKQLVEIMDGSIWLESHPGVGSVFYFTARLQIGSESDIIADNVTGQHFPLRLNPLRILLAEDDTLNQKFGIEILQRQGHTITVASNGNEVLDLLNKKVFDLVLMDVSMPEMDGIEVTKIIRNSVSGTFDRNIPIIAQTAHSIKGDKEKFLQVGMGGYISKPIDVDELVKEMAKIAPRFINRQTDRDALDQDPSITEDKHTVFDLDVMRKRFGGKKEFFIELFGYFLAESPKRMAAINTAIELGDLEKLSALAHSFKGVATTVCAADLSDFCAKLEQAARADDLERAKLYVKEISLVLDRAREISIDDLFRGMLPG